jgi:hypothetical protein
MPVRGNDTGPGGALDQIRSLFRHHQRAGVDVGRDKIRHGRGIDDAQAFDSPRAQFRIARLGLVQSHPAGARRMMRDQATRQAIVGAARRLFSERGYFTTKVDDIAALARVAPATVYAVSGGKQGLLRTLKSRPRSGHLGNYDPLPQRVRANGPASYRSGRAA